MLLLVQYLNLLMLTLHFHVGITGAISNADPQLHVQNWEWNYSILAFGGQHNSTTTAESLLIPSSEQNPNPFSKAARESFGRRQSASRNLFSLSPLFSQPLACLSPSTLTCSHVHKDLWKEWNTFGPVFVLWLTMGFLAAVNFSMCDKLWPVLTLVTQLSWASGCQNIPITLLRHPQALRAWRRFG